MLESFLSGLKCKTVLVRSHTVSYLNKFGGLGSVTCDGLAKQIWSFCIGHKIYLFASNIKGMHKVIADKASRVEMRLNIPC